LLDVFGDRAIGTCLKSQTRFWNLLEPVWQRHNPYPAVPAPPLLADDALVNAFGMLAPDRLELFRAIHKCMPKQVCGRHRDQHRALEITISAVSERHPNRRNIKVKPLKWWADEFIAAAPHLRGLDTVSLYCKSWDRASKGWDYAQYNINLIFTGN